LGGQRAINAPSNMGLGVPARCPRGRTSRCNRVGKIALRRAIIISVPGNFAHPTLIGFMESIN
jgi:hypothetical protein